MRLQQVLTQWRAAKAKEKSWQERRRSLEDQLAMLLPIPLHGSCEVKAAGHRITITARRDWTVDAVALRELVQANGLEAEAEALFKWTAEVRAGAWDRAAPAVTALFAPAVVQKVTRPSWAIEVDHAPESGAQSGPVPQGE
jgi:hypothetical protein